MVADVQYKLIYFNVRGRAEPLRYMFALADVPYEDVRPEFADWPKLKPSMPMGALPVLMVNGKPLCQTVAIGRYLASEFGLKPKSSWAIAWGDMLVDGLVDMLRTFRHVNMHAFMGDMKKMEEAWQAFKKEHLHQFLTRYENYLIDNNGEYFIGDKLTWVDIFIAEQVNRFVELFDNESLLDGYPHLMSHMERVQNLPRIKKYCQSRPKTTT